MSEAKQADDTVVYGGRVYKKPPAWRMWVIYGLGLLLVMILAGPWGIAVVLAFVGLGKLVGKNAEKRVGLERDAFTELCQKEGVEYKPNYSDGERGLLLGLAEESARMLVQFRSPMAADKLAWATRKIDVKKVLNVELAVNDQAVYKAGPVATLAGAALGGLTFGGFGAVTGALATGRAGAGKIGTLTLKLRIDDIDEPLVEVPFIVAPIKASDADAKARLALAEKWTNLVEVLRHRCAQPEIALLPTRVK